MKLNYCLNLLMLSLVLFNSSSAQSVVNDTQNVDVLVTPLPTPNIALQRAYDEANQRHKDSFETMKKAVAEDFATYGIP